VKQEPEPFVEIHPDDAESHRIEDGEWVFLVSRRGRTYTRVRVTTGIRKGTLFMPFHWGELFHPETNVNRITNPILIPFLSNRN
jgi:anaerobic selenocysteine-containing dehydrogenase